MRPIAAWIVLLGALALTGQAQSPAQAPVLGRVVAAATGAPLPSARVDTDPSVEGTPPAITDAEGRFALDRAAGPRLRLSISKPGYLPATAPLATNGSVDVSLIKAGAIAGRIMDTKGDPAIGRTVRVEVAVATGVPRTIVATAITDDLGDYRLSGLPEGRYLLGVTTTSPPPPGRPGEVPVYFPGPQAEPQAITVATGEERWAIDLVVPMLTADSPNRRPLEPAGGGVIRGRILTSDGTPLSGATVRLDTEQGEGDFVMFLSRRSPVITDEQGRYEFLETEAGSYVVMANKTGFVAMRFGQRRAVDRHELIALRRGESRNNADITLPRLSAITGRVVDEAGEPVEGASIRVMRIGYVGGRRRLVDTGGQRIYRTDDRGVYRVSGLQPNEYVVSAAVGQLARRRVVGVVVAEPMADLPGYTTTYYPGSANPGDALRVTVQPGQDATGIEFGLVRAATARITGTVVDAAGAPITDGLILSPSRRSGVIAQAPVGASIDDDGNFEFPNVAPGEYVIQASISTGDPFDEGESASQFVTVSGTDVTGVAIRLSRGSSVRGRVTFDSTAPPDSLFGLDLQALPVDMDLTPQNLEGGPASARAEEDGTFTIAGLSGPRVIRLQSPRWALKAVLVNGRDVTDTPLVFATAAQSVEGVEVILTDRVTTIGGRAVDARSRGVPDARVVVFSTDRALWGEGSRHITSTVAGKDGAFTVRRLPPGPYYAAAVSDMAGDDWRDPDVLDALVPGAILVTLDDGAAATALVRIAR